MSGHLMRCLGVFMAAGLVLGSGAQCTPSQEASEPTGKLPKLVDIGAKTCIPCKKMAPILEELASDYAGKFDVEFIDVSVDANVARAEKYKIKLIPTQIFLDPSGKELWRHQGFLGKEAILGKWRELGYKLQ